jgi:hypothetical protein
MGPDYTPGGIERLIIDSKGARSMSQFARDCGGNPSDKRLHQMISTPMKNFPDPETIRGLARGANVSITQVVLACAKSVGLPVGEGEPGDLTIAGARDLPAQAQEVIVSVGREMLHLYKDMPADSHNKPLRRVQ